MSSRLPVVMACLVAVAATLGGVSGAAAAQAPGAVPAAPAAERMLQLGLGLLAVLAAIAVTAWVARRALRLQGGAREGELRVLGSLSLGGRERAVLVQVGEAQVLLGVAPGRVAALHRLEQPLRVPGAQPGEFAGRLAGAARRLRGQDSGT